MSSPSKMRLLLLIGFLSLFVDVHPAGAGIVYQQPVLNANQRGAFSDFAAQQQLADQFTLVASATIRDVHWSGSYFLSDLSAAVSLIDFKIRFFADDGGLPQVNPFYETNVTATVSESGVIFDDRKIYTVQTQILPLNIAGGTLAWISIVENDPDTTDLWHWANSNVSVGDTMAFRGVDGGGWVPEGGDRGNLAFALTDDGLARVPGPGPLLLVTSGLAALGILLRRRGRRT